MPRQGQNWKQLAQTRSKLKTAHIENKSSDKPTVREKSGEMLTRVQNREKLTVRMKCNEQLSIRVKNRETNLKQEKAIP